MIATHSRKITWCHRKVLKLHGERIKISLTEEVTETFYCFPNVFNPQQYRREQLNAHICLKKSKSTTSCDKSAIFADCKCVVFELNKKRSLLRCVECTPLLKN